jgi:hypothetical protein
MKNVSIIFTSQQVPIFLILIAERHLDESHSRLGACGHQL